jgi:hypothetical protein
MAGRIVATSLSLPLSLDVGDVLGHRSKDTLLRRSGFSKGFFRSVSTAAP